jgi:hypothetical protein
MTDKQQGERDTESMDDRDAQNARAEERERAGRKRDELKEEHGQEYELKISEENVYEEHLAAVNVPAHWAYLVGVLVIGLAIMVVFIALLGAGAG